MGAPAQGSATALFIALYALSGGAALVYEISWSRQLGALFGHSAIGAAVTLAGYFAGMAIGYAGGGRLAVRFPFHPAAGYAACEIVVALWALALPAVLDVARSLDVFGPLDFHAPLPTLGRVFAGVLMLLPGACALGAAWPFAVRLLSAGDRGRERRKLVAAYSLHTAAAILGALLATFVGIAFAGVVGTSWIASGISLSCGAVALALGLPRSAPRAEDSARTRVGRRWLVAAALSGFVTLMLEVLFVQLLSLVLYNSTYTLALTLASFLLWLAVAAAWVARPGTTIDPTRLVGQGARAAAFALPLCVAVFWAGSGLRSLDLGTGFWSYMGGVALLAAVVTALPVLGVGVVLPASWIGGAGASPGGSGVAGRITAWNGAFGASGALVASLVVPGSLGLWGGFVAVAGLLFAMSEAFTISTGRSRLVRSGAFAATLAVATALVMPESGLPPGVVLITRLEGSHGWVDVVEEERTGRRQLRQNLHYALGDSASAEFERRLGVLPVLLHPSPRRVVALGGGTGITAGAILAAPGVQSLHVVELVPEVLEASRHFVAENGAYFEDPRVQLVVDDARHFLEETDLRFDVIAADLVLPALSRAGYLYTEDMYDSARARLSDGGIFTQWLPLYQMNVREFELIADSFRAAFPHTTLWWGQLQRGSEVVLLAGSQRPLTLELLEIERRLAAMRPPGRVLSTEGVVRSYLGAWAERPGARLNTDELPRVEFFAPIFEPWSGRLSADHLSDYARRVLSRLPPGETQLQVGGRPIPLPIEEIRRIQRALLVDSSGGVPRDR